jgi:hypothetical protein
MATNFNNSVNIKYLLLFTIVLINGRKAGDTGSDKLTNPVFGYNLPDFHILLKHVRTGTDNAHLAFQNIQKLRQLVEIGLAQQIPDPGIETVILCGKLTYSVFRFLLSIFRLTHGAEFATEKKLVIDTFPFLSEQDMFLIGRDPIIENGHAIYISHYNHPLEVATVRAIPDNKNPPEIVKQV